MPTASRLRCLTLATILVAGSTRAQDEASAAIEVPAAIEGLEPIAATEEHGFSARARVTLPPASRNSLDATAAGTAIRIEGRPQSGESLRDVLVEAPGARVLSTGAIGQFNAIALRGTELGQTSVMLDDLPLGGPDVGPVDLSLLPLAAFGSVEVYRGGAPAWIADGAIGGVVRLVPRTASTTSIRAVSEAGAFGTYRGGVESTVADGALSLVTSAGVLTSRQDYRFLNENGTLFDPSDDVVERQRNAEVVQRHVFTSARIASGNSRVDVVYLGIGRDGGYPGAGLRRTLYAHQTIAQNVASAAYTYEAPLDARRSIRVQARLGANSFRNEFLDEYGAVGLGAVDTDDRTRVISGRLAATIDATRRLAATVIGSARSDHLAYYDRLSPDGRTPPATRGAFGGSAELRAHGRVRATDLEMRGSFLAQTNRLEARIRRDFGEYEDYRDVRTITTGRLGFVVAPSQVFAIQGSFHRGARAPSVLELFGNRSSIAPNPDLRPETGLGGDLGATVRHAGDAFCLIGEARVYAQSIDDVIVFVPTSQFQARAKNLPRSLVLGFESSARLTYREHLDVVVQWNATRAHDSEGYQLPNRPIHNAYARIAGSVARPRGAFSDLRVYADLTTISRTYLTTKELAAMPARTFVGLGLELSLFESQLRGSFSVRDLADVGGTDFLGYPLSGRSFSGTLSYRKEFP